MAEPARPPRLATLPGRLAGLAGRRRALVLAGLGGGLALSLPPVHLLPAALAGLTGLAWVLDGAGSVRRALLDGWFFGIGFSLAGFYWIANALLVDAGRFGWLYPFALALICAGLGAFPALAAGLARACPPGPPRVLALALAWVLVEWVRGWILTGFPWNTLGSALALSDALIQPAAWGGPWLLSAVVLAFALAPALAGRAGMLRPGGALAGVAGAIAVLAVVWAAGASRLASAAPEAETGPTIRLVQPAIAQEDKSRPALRAAHLAAHLALTLARPAGEPPAVVVWPEAAVPHALLREPATLARLAAAAPRDGALLVGAVRAGDDGSGVSRPRNSLLAIDATGVVGAYDKHRLVPFGEYVPARGLLPFGTIVPGGVGFAAGPGPAVMAVGNLPPFGPLICYEVIFPAGVVGDGDRPDWLVNVTNDAWFGRSPGPYQHFQAARMRAVEQGLPVVRVANTGVSGVVDGLGRVVARMPLGHRGVLDAALPAPLAAPPLYARIGDASLLLVLVPGCAALAWTLRRRGRPVRQTS